jgi:hypothetical protein
LPRLVQTFLPTDLSEMEGCKVPSGNSWKNNALFRLAEKTGGGEEGCTSVGEDKRSHFHEI